MRIRSRQSARSVRTPAFGVGVGVRCLDRSADHLYVFGAEDLVEGVRDLAVAVVQEEAEGVLVARAA
jgi:hypothetical protein